MNNNKLETRNAAIIDDESSWRRRFNSVLDSAGWNVVAQATTMDEALLFINRILELNVRLVLLDGFLTKGNQMTKEEYLAEGGKIAQEIMALFPDVVILGVSSVGTYQSNDPNIKSYAGKENTSLIKALREID